MTERPTDILRDEHQQIEAVLQVLDDLAEEARRGPFDRAKAGEILTFLREFADRNHHGKEERCLFPRLAQHGYGPELGPVAVMLHEHELGRQFLRQMGSALDEPEAEGAARRFADAANGYVQLLAHHIEKENMILFRIAESLFDEDDQAAVKAGFDAVEREEMGDGARERLQALAGRIVSSSGKTSA
ncbi:MAG: hemerythrin domain-containing protein [Candidatus Eisenbacteria bacterium]